MKAVLLSLAAAALAVPAVRGAAASEPQYHLIKSISLPGDGGWDYMTLDSRARLLYIARGTHVSVVNVDTGEAVGDIPDTNGVHGVAIDPKTGHGFTSNGRSNTVTVFDTKTFKKISEIPVGEGPDAIVFDPVTERVFTFNGRGQSATAIDGKTEKVVGTVTLPGRPEFPVSDGKGHLYDNIEDKSEIVEIDPSGLKVTAEWPIAPAEGPSGLAMDRKGRRLFSVCDGQKLAVVNADTGKVVATPTIGNGPDACAYDAKDRLVFSPNGQDGTMTIFKQVSPDNYEAIQTLETQAGARTMAFDEKTGNVYTVTAKTQPPAPGTEQTGRRRRSYVPGSFVVLEYGK
jgi:YVTN family beta-propeller protein